MRGDACAVAHFILVEDNDHVAHVYRRVFESFGTVALARSVAEARSVLAAAHVTGLVADISLPDGSGLDVAREARARMKDLPILIISGDVNSVRLDTADELFAAILEKPIRRSQLIRFAERAIARERRAATLLVTWMYRYSLSAAEMMTLRLAVDGLTRDDIVVARGVSLNTVKTQIAALLGKRSVATLAQAVAAFYAELAGST